MVSVHTAQEKQCKKRVVLLNSLLEIKPTATIMIGIEFPSTSTGIRVLHSTVPRQSPGANRPQNAPIARRRRAFTLLPAGRNFLWNCPALARSGTSQEEQHPSVLPDKHRQDKLRDGAYHRISHSLNTGCAPRRVGGQPFCVRVHADY